MPQLDEPSLQQVDPGLYQDKSGYWSGTLDAPNFLGTDIGQARNPGGSSTDPTGLFPSTEPGPRIGTQPVPTGGGAYSGSPGTTIDTNAPGSFQSKLPDQRFPAGSLYGTQGTSGGGGGDWISQALTLAESTDDPAYWRRVIAADPKVAAGDQSAIDYWKQRIAQGDGARAVREGRVQRFQDSGGGGGASGANPNQVLDYNGAVNYVNSKLGRTLTPQEIAAAFAKFGGNTGSSFTAGGLDQVVNYFRTPAAKTGAGLNPNGNPTGFADPAYQGLMDLVNQRLANLSKPVEFPGMQDYMTMLKERQAGGRARAQSFADTLGQRVGQLQKPLLNDADVANQNALASNALLAQRDATLKNQREKRFAQGFAPTSGLLAGDERATNENYNNRQAMIDAQLRQHQIQGDEQRRNQATSLQGLATQALEGGDISALGNQATISQLENQLYNIGEGRQRESLTTGNIPVELTNMGTANANAVANSGGDPMSQIMNLLNSAQTQQGLQQASSGGNMSALMEILKLFMPT